MRIEEPLYQSTFFNSHSNLTTNYTNNNKKTSIKVFLFYFFLSSSSYKKAVFKSFFFFNNYKNLKKKKICFAKLFSWKIIKTVFCTMVLKTEPRAEPFFQNSWFNPVFDPFQGFLLDRTGSWFPVELVGPASLVWFLKQGSIQDKNCFLYKIIFFFQTVFLKKKTVLRIKICFSKLFKKNVFQVKKSAFKTGFFHLKKTFSKNSF